MCDTSMRSLAVLMLLAPAGRLLAEVQSQENPRPQQNAHFVYESRMSDGSELGEDLVEADGQDDVLGISLNATYDTAPHRGGRWEFGGEYHRDFAGWGVTAFGRLYPDAKSRYSALDCGCGDDEEPMESHFEKKYTAWQLGLHVQKAFWHPAGGEVSVFAEVAGPGIVANRGMDLQTGLMARWELSEPLCLYTMVGGNYSTARLEKTREAYAFADAEADYTTGWLPNKSDHWFLGIYVESGEIKEEGAFVEVSGGFGFAIANGVDVDMRIGTELASPYDEREDITFQAGMTWTF
jgi:hypothetical protein